MKKGFTTYSRFKKPSKREIRNYLVMLEELSKIKIGKSGETYLMEKDGQLCLFA